MGDTFLEDDQYLAPVGSEPNVERAAIEVNTLVKEVDGGSSCDTCGQGLANSHHLSCGRCGKQVHEGCIKPRHKGGYWYCGDCTPHLERVDPAQDIEL